MTPLRFIALGIFGLAVTAAVLHSRLPGDRPEEQPEATMAAASAARAPCIYLTHGGEREERGMCRLPPLLPPVRIAAASCRRSPPTNHLPAFPSLLAGGPFPVIGGPGHAGLTKFLKAWPTSLPEPPKALLVVSGHWETAVPTVTSAPRPELIYDYHG